MNEEIFLVSPSEEYKNTYLQGMEELQTDSKNNSNSGEFVQDLEYIKNNFDKFVELKLNKEKGESERMSLYEIAPEEVKSQLSKDELEALKHRKVKPENDFWIMKKNEGGELQFIGSMSIRPSQLDVADLQHGASEFSAWKGCLGKNVPVGVETSSFLIPSARGKGYIDIARGEFMEKLKERGVDSIVSKVVSGNVASHKKQKELVDFCGGTFFDKHYKDGDVTRYIINVNPEDFKQKMSEKLKLRNMIGKFRGTETENKDVRINKCEISLQQMKSHEGR